MCSPMLGCRSCWSTCPSTLCLHASAEPHRGPEDVANGPAKEPAPIAEADAQRGVPVARDRECRYGVHDLLTIATQAMLPAFTQQRLLVGIVHVQRTLVSADTLVAAVRDKGLAIVEVFFFWDV